MCPHSSHTPTETVPEYTGPSGTSWRAKSNLTTQLILLEFWHCSAAISPLAATGRYDTNFALGIQLNRERKSNWLIPCGMPLIYT